MCEINAYNIIIYRDIICTLRLSNVHILWVILADQLTTESQLLQNLHNYSIWGKQGNHPEGIPLHVSCPHTIYCPLIHCILPLHSIASLPHARHETTPTLYLQLHLHKLLYIRVVVINSEIQVVNIIRKCVVAV